jgi:hypothetical protein
MTDATLKPCPFCGTAPELRGAAVHCPCCKVGIQPNWAAGPKATQDNWQARMDWAIANTTARWNRRAGEVA